MTKTGAGTTQPSSHDGRTSLVRTRSLDTRFEKWPPKLRDEHLSGVLYVHEKRWETSVEGERCGLTWGGGGDEGGGEACEQERAVGDYRVGHGRS